MSTATGGERRRLRDSPIGSVIVIVVTTLLIVGGVWAVNAMNRDDDAPSASATESTAVSEVELTGDMTGDAPEVGKLAPDFTILDTESNPVILSELQGKPVWLVFGATWCSNCRAETPDVQAIEDKYGDKVEIIAIHVGESLATVTDYGQRLGLTYTQVADKYTDVGSAYRVMGLPTHFFVDADGKVDSIEMGTITERAASDRLDKLLKG